MSLTLLSYRAIRLLVYKFGTLLHEGLCICPEDAAALCHIDTFGQYDHCAVKNHS